MSQPTYKHTVGTRAEVMHGNAHHTSGGLTKNHLKYNKHGRIVSRKKSEKAKKDRRLEKKGYFTQKGKFGFVKRDDDNVKNKRKTRRSK